MQNLGENNVLGFELEAIMNSQMYEIGFKKNTNVLKLGERHE
jgi:hypothetical protein